MSESYVECLVARKPSFVMQFLKTLLIMLTVVFVLVGFISLWRVRRLWELILYI